MVGIGGTDLVDHGDGTDQRYRFHGKWRGMTVFSHLCAATDPPELKQSIYGAVMGTGGAHGDVGVDEDEIITLRQKLQKGKGMGKRPPEMKTAKFWKEADWRKYGLVPEDEYKSKYSSRSSGWTRQEDAAHGKWEESPYTGSSGSWHHQPGSRS